VYAVVRVAGKQVIVRPEEDIKVPRLEADIGSTISLDDVMLYADGADVRVGRPSLGDIRIVAEIIGHGRDPKITVFKMKRRKGYRRKTGHRQGHTVLKIKEISA